MKKNKGEMNNNESISLTVASLITFFIFGVLLIAFYVSDNNVLLTFSGSVVGAFLSGCISFAVMYFTNKAGKENVEQTLRQNEIQYLTNQRLSVRPYILVEVLAKSIGNSKLQNKYLSESDGLLSYEFGEDGMTQTTIKTELILNNVGKATAVECEIKGVDSISKNKRYFLKEKYTSYTNIKCSIMPDNLLGIILRLSFSEKRNEPSEHILLYIEYKDVLGNCYAQKIKMMVFENDALIEEISTPILRKANTTDLSGYWIA